MATKAKKSGANVILAGFNFAGAQSEAINTVAMAVLTEKRDPKEVRADFIVGVMQRQLACTVAQAQAAFKASGKDSKEQADKRRTDREETAYGAGRTAWSRVARPAGVLADKRGGARTVKKAKKAGKAAKSKAVIGSPKVASLADAQAHVRNMALMLSGFVAKNATVFEGDGAALASAVADFVGTINKLT